MTPFFSVTVTRRYLAKLFEVLSPIELFLFAVASSGGLLYLNGRGVLPWVLWAWHAGVCAAFLAVGLVFIQGLALAFCDLLRRHEFRHHAAEAQKVADAKAKKGYRSYQPNMRKLSMRERAKLWLA